jgi:hypothetical protein
MRKRGAFALIVVLFLMLVLLMLAGMLVERSRLGARFQLEDQRSAGAQWAAQSGVAYALSQWTADKAWSTDVIDYVLPGSEASFSIRFGPTASVNNLNQLTPADCELGAGSVPADRAYLVVEGRCQGRIQRLSALVGPAGLQANQASGSAILASGNITFDGVIHIRGARSTDDASPVDANLVTTASGVSNAIQSLGGSVVVEGKVQSNGVAGSIDTTNISTTKGFGYSASLAPPPDPDIPGRVAARSSAPTPVLPPGAAVLASGDFYFPAGLNYSGDLKLGDSNLYVEGPVNVTGSISGKGSLFVNGDATLTGSADVTAADPLGLGVYVQGDLSLNGVDGQNYLQDLSTATGNMDQLKAANTMISEMAAAINDPNSANGTNLYAPIAGWSSHRRFSNSGGWLANNSSDFDALGDLLGHGANLNDGTTIGSGPGSFVLGPGTRNSLATLRAMVEADVSPANATQNSFVLKRFDQLIDSSGEGMLSWHGSVADCLGDLQATLTSGSTLGLADALNDIWEDPGLTGNTTIMANRERLRQRLSYAVATLADNLGSSTIRGNIYCRGNLTCDHDLQVVGSVTAGGPNSNISLKNTQVTFIQETANQAGSSLGLMGVRCWYRH